MFTKFYICVKIKKGGIIMKLKEFFKGKRFVFCFIAYILLTIIIIASSLTDAATSKKQSEFVSQTFSNVVKFLTGGSLDLNSNGNADVYPKSIQLNNVPNRDLMVGETFFITYEFEDGKKYDYLSPSYYSTNKDVLDVNSQTGEVKVISVGSANLGVKETISNTKCEANVIVGNEEFIPRLELIKGSSEVDGNYYFNPSNCVGSLYYIYIDTQIDPNSLTISCEDAEAFEFLPSKSTLVFLTKKVGRFNILISGKYYNINTITSGLEQTITKTFSVNVVSANLLQPATDFAFESQIIEAYKNEKTEISILNDRNGEGATLLESQTSLFHSYDKNALTIESENNKLLVTPKTTGSFDYKIYYSDGFSIKTAILKINSTFIPPSQLEFKTSNKNAIIGYPTHLTIIGDGNKLDAKDFIWTSSNNKVATVKNGRVIGHTFGTVTITATAKHNENLSIQYSFKTVASFEYWVRKILGHFLLFAILAFFAKQVYFRLAKVTLKNKISLFAIIFTIVAGIITASMGEVLQLDAFAVERNFSFIDILIDFLGYLFGFTLTLLTWHLTNKRKNKKV